MQTRKYTHVDIREVTRHSGRAQNERTRLFQAKSPVTNRNQYLSSTLISQSSSQSQENKGLFSSDEESTSTSECPYKQEESSC